MLNITDDVIDMLLDQEGFECDPISQREGDTPLHSAVRWANEQPTGNQENVLSLISMMLEAGSDPRFVGSILLCCLPVDITHQNNSLPMLWHF